MNPDLYQRGCDTLLASWDAYARGAAGAALQRRLGVAAAVFPNEPERNVYNNALLQRGLGMSRRADALDAMEDAYADVWLARPRDSSRPRGEPCWLMIPRRRRWSVSPATWASRRTISAGCSPPTWAPA